MHPYAARIERLSVRMPDDAACAVREAAAVALEFGGNRAAWPWQLAHAEDVELRWVLVAASNAAYAPIRASLYFRSAGLADRAETALRRAERDLLKEAS